MEKIVIEKLVESKYKYFQGTSLEIDELTNHLIDLKHLGANRIDVNPDEDRDGSIDGYEFNGTTIRLETDQEFEQRISAEKIKKETVEAKERLQYLKLKEKYDGK